MKARVPPMLVAALAAALVVSTARQAGAAEPTDDPVRILALLDVPFQPEGTLTDQEAGQQRKAITQTIRDLRKDLEKTDVEDFDRFQTVPFVALEMAPEDLDEVTASPEVVAVQEDAALQPMLAESTARVEAPGAWAMGATGSGQTVAILDTGVEAAHPFLGGRVVEEACYSAGKDCPNGKAIQLGVGSARPCTYSMDCGHGTHVAGIAAGSGTSFSGVAPGAKVMAVQVFSEASGVSLCGYSGTCALAMTSDLIKAMERVYALRTVHSFAAVNLSLGWGSFTGPCDTDPMKPIIDNLRTAGIATVVASGNAGNPGSMSAPACISSAVSVGATTDGTPEEVAGYSNSSPALSVLAPGSSITSSVPGGGFATWEGTSMAAPHVAGAWAVLKAANPTAAVPTVLSNLQTTGQPITDGRNGRTTPRIRVHGALTGQGWTPPAAPVAHPRHLTLRLSRHLVAVGDVVVPDGSPVCLTGRVAIERKAGKRWKKVRTASSAQDGSYKVRLPDRPGRFRAAVLPTAECEADVSPPRTYRRRSPSR